MQSTLLHTDANLGKPPCKRNCAQKLPAGLKGRSHANSKDEHINDVDVQPCQQLRAMLSKRRIFNSSATFGGSSAWVEEGE